MTTLPRPSRLRPWDVFRLGALGTRTRPLRAVLSALGIAIGVAAMVAVVSIPSSSAQALRDRIAALGANLLTAQAGQTVTGADADLPETAVAMVRRIGPVTSASAVGQVEETVRRTDRVAPQEGIPVFAATPDLLDVLRGSVDSGTFLNPTTERHPTVVLGSVTATRLGIDRLSPGMAAPQVWIGGQWFTVVGILGAMPLAPEIERAALVGWTAARQRLGFGGHPGTIYLRSVDSEVEQVRGVLARTANPERPGQVKVSRPSDALAAGRLAEDSYHSLFLGLGGVALLVGGVGVANTMIIAVLERRREIGLRRALGATRRQVRGQFLTESVLLSGLGGVVGVLLGMSATAAYALSQQWPAVFPPAALIGGVGVAALLGVLAGVYPAMRAARLTPTEALA
ncbi:ABC transporter permease [Actinocrispum wychmicini]|uniref:Putative ABC transport system permease protein n=1 Tax=Actinocrispum wychmicini TaxID=1213861 RepID=A0A4R2JHW7_9PSEU|nr:ABC transporter permease [Actinocrispum wychmicini]TCO55999.1 putative ABC transport system permease protein [Actinocrispum wychmicini]